MKYSIAAISSVIFKKKKIVHLSLFTSMSLIFKTASFSSLPYPHILKMKRLLKEEGISKITIYQNNPLRWQKLSVSGINGKRVTLQVLNIIVLYVANIFSIFNIRLLGLLYYTLASSCNLATILLN